MKRTFGALLFSSLLLTAALALAGDTSTSASACPESCPVPCAACPGSCPSSCTP